MTNSIITASASIERAEEHRITVGRGLARLADVTRHKDDIGEVTARHYAEALDDLDPHDLNEAFREAARYEEWFPPAAVIRKYAEEAQAQRKKREEEARREEVRRDVMERLAQEEGRA